MPVDRTIFVTILRSKEVQSQFEKNMFQLALDEHTPDAVRESMINLRRIWMPIARRFTPN